MGRGPGLVLTRAARPSGRVTALEARSRTWSRILALLRRLGQRPLFAIFLLGLLGLSGGPAIGFLRGLPAPTVHDEFSYLLAGETFAQGRLTNPTHPRWQHFETFHVIHEPSYQSKYPPGQGIVLAVGERIAGSPLVGVWLAGGALSAAVAWALLGILPGPWALLAGLVCVFQVNWFSYWAHSFWGGTAAALGGALAFGAVVRLWRRPRRSQGVLLGVGMGILSVTRPLEGMLVGAVLVGSLFLAWRGAGSASKAPLTRTLLSAGLAVLPFLLAHAAYNHAVTGHPLRMPYQVHAATYSASPSLLLHEPGDPPSYRHREMERYWMEWGRERHLEERSFPRIVLRIPGKLRSYTLLFLGPFALALAGLLLRRSPDPVMWTALLGTAVVAASVLLTKGAYAHYLAPATVLIYALAGKGMVSLHRASRRSARLCWPLLILAGTVLLWGVRMVSAGLEEPSGFGVDRLRIARELTALSGTHLVLVRYGENHNYHQEWVQNGPDIDDSRIVWARSMGPEEDDELRSHFAERTPWSMYVSGEEVLLTPYPPRDRQPSDGPPVPAQGRGPSLR